MQDIVTSMFKVNNKTVDLVSFDVAMVPNTNFEHIQQSVQYIDLMIL